MKLLIVTDTGEVAVIDPATLQLIQLNETTAIVALPSYDPEGRKVFPIAQFNAVISLIPSESSAVLDG